MYYQTEPGLAFCHADTDNAVGCVKEATHSDNTNNESGITFYYIAVNDHIVVSLVPGSKTRKQSKVHVINTCFYCHSGPLHWTVAIVWVSCFFSHSQLHHIGTSMHGEMPSQDFGNTCHSNTNNQGEYITPGVVWFVFVVMGHPHIVCMYYLTKLANVV